MELHGHNTCLEPSAVARIIGANNRALPIARFDTTFNNISQHIATYNNIYNDRQQHITTYKYQHENSVLNDVS